MSTDESEFQSLALDASSWLQQSHQFFLAAKQLVPTIKRKTPLTRDTAEEISALAVGSLKATLLLLGVSVENALKAVIVKRGGIAVLNGKICKSAFGSSKGGHDLVWLYQAAGLALEDGELELLEQLTEVVVWAGRYQQPLNESDYGRAKAKNPRKITIPTDLNVIENILKKARSSVGERA